MCLGLFFGSHLIARLAEWTEVLLFLVGVVLVIVDLFFIAGFGAAGIPGIALMFTGIFLSLMGRFELWTWPSVTSAIRPLLFAFVVTVVLAVLMLRALPRTSTWRRLVLHAEERADQGYRADAGYGELVGAEGVAFTMLRPGGTGLFKGRRVSVSTEGEFIEKDTPITVMEVEGNRIVVRRKDQV